MVRSLRLQALVFALAALVFAGCTGGTATVVPGMINAPQADFQHKITSSFRIGPGSQNIYSGGSSSWYSVGSKVNVDLKQVMETAANVAMDTNFTDRGDAPQDLNIVATISNFNYRHPWRFRHKRRVMVSFNLNLTATDASNNLVYTKMVSVVEAIGTEDNYKKGFGGWTPKDAANETSQLVGATALEKVHEIFDAEFPEMAKRVQVENISE